MKPANDAHITKNIAIADQVLSKAFGVTVQLNPPEIAGEGTNRAKVYRCKVVGGSSDVPESVIIKYVNLKEGELYDPEASEGHAERIHNEWASLQLLTELASGVPPAPRFYGGDRQTGLIVMEDMGVGTSLIQPLLGNDPVAAEEALCAYFTALGRVNAMTVGKEASYNRIRDRLGPRNPRPSIQTERDRLLDCFNSACTAIDVKPSSGYESEMQHAASFISEPGPFLALSQTDTCPDNCLRIGHQMRLLDFEFGSFGHALNDGARARSNFPTCWCVYRFPDHIIQRTEAVYRTELVKGCPAAADDTLFYRAIVQACAYWTIETFSMFMPNILDQDERWGVSTVRQRVIVRLDSLSQAAKEFGYLEALGATAEAMATKFRTLRPSEATQMPYYPAFQ